MLFSRAAGRCPRDTAKTRGTRESVSDLPGTPSPGRSGPAEVTMPESVSVLRLLRPWIPGSKEMDWWSCIPSSVSLVQFKKSWKKSRSYLAYLKKEWASSRSSPTCTLFSSAEAFYLLCCSWDQPMGLDKEIIPTHPQLRSSSQMRREKA